MVFSMIILELAVKVFQGQIGVVEKSPVTHHVV
jgi:hypothetical protein